MAYSETRAAMLRSILRIVSPEMVRREGRGKCCGWWVGRGIEICCCSFDVRWQDVSPPACRDNISWLSGSKKWLCDGVIYGAMACSIDTK